MTSSRVFLILVVPFLGVFGCGSGQGSDGVDASASLADAMTSADSDVDPDAENCQAQGACALAACFDDPGCIENDLAALGTFTECGSVTNFSAEDSDTLCAQSAATLDSFDPIHCGMAAFAGELRFYCSVSGDAVATRYRVAASMPTQKGSLWSSWDTEYHEGNSSGSGGSHTYIDESRVLEQHVDVVGYRVSPIPANQSIISTLLFVVNDRFSTAESFVGGGYQVELQSDWN